MAMSSTVVGLGNNKSDLEGYFWTLYDGALDTRMIEFSRC